MRIIFMGSPDFAVPSLLALQSSEHELVAVVTQPDRPFGRKLHVHSPPVKTAAGAMGIPILQPSTTRSPEFVHEIKRFQPDLLVVVAYGEILRSELLEAAHCGAINLHASLLPRYRGAAPVAWAILNGEEETGCTTMQIGRKMDAGDIYLQERCPIGSADTTESLTKKLAGIGAPLLKRTVDGIANKLQPVPQDPTAVTFAPKLKKEDGWVRWSQSSEWISRQTRAFYPWPGTFSTLQGSLIKFLLAQPSMDKTSDPPGTVISPGRSALHVACGDGTVLQILELQPQNRPRMRATDFVNGAHLPPGSRFETPANVS